jgi:hypothetical protein
MKVAEAEHTGCAPGKNRHLILATAIEDAGTESFRLCIKKSLMSGFFKPS